MPFDTKKAAHPISRRALLTLTALAPLATLLVACGNTKRSAPLASIQLEEFPTGVGRGYPLGTLVGTDNTATGIQPGEIAPNFRLQLDNEQGLYLTDLVGRPILINFWATWCGPCRQEMPEIVHQAEANPELVIIAVNVQEEAERVAAFANDFDMNMLVVRDIDAEIRDLYQVRGMPTTVFIDRAGKVSTYRPGVMTAEMLDELLAPILS